MRKARTPGELITAAELAQRLRLSPYTVKQLARRKRIPSIFLSPRVQRFDLEKVMVALEKGKPVVQKPQPGRYGRKK